MTPEAATIVKEPRRRAPRTFGRVALGGVALAAVIVAVTAALYLRFVRYERLAARHVPAGSTAAVRLDVQQAILYDPARRHLLPLLGGPHLTPTDGDARLSRLEALTGIRRGDLREIVVARGASDADWVLVLAGLFPKDVGAPQLGAALASGGEAWTVTPDVHAVVNAAGVTVGRGPDGVVIVASSEAVFRAARLESTAARELGLGPTGPGSFGVGADALRALGPHPMGCDDPMLASFVPRLERVSGVVTLGDRVSLAVTAVTASGVPGPAEEPAAAGKAAAWALAKLRLFGHAGASPAKILARGAADRASILPAGDRAATLQLAWEREEVDRAFGLLADEIRSRL